jgi:hypothetical protein
VNLYGKQRVDGRDRKQIERHLLSATKAQAGVLSVRTFCFYAGVEDDLLRALLRDGVKRPGSNAPPRLARLPATGQAIGFDSSKALGATIANPILSVRTRERC